jgi:hypothetical protein
VGVVQHYRASAPDVLLVVPRFGKDDRVDGEMDVRLTAAEAARLRERLTAVLVAVTSAPPVLHAPQAATRTSSIDAHCAQLLAAEPSCGGRLEAEPHTVKLGTPKIDEMSIEACLSAWSGDGGPRDFEVTIDVDHSILVSCTPQQAREAAESLRRIAGVIAELADAAEALQQGEPELGSRAATEPVALVAYRADMPSAA